jgi:hypothetical protein
MKEFINHAGPVDDIATTLLWRFTLRLSCQLEHKQPGDDQYSLSESESESDVEEVRQRAVC